MTRQEASKIIEQYRMCSSGDCPTLECADCEYNHDPRKVEEAFLMAIDALESAQPEPCEDCVSRKSVIRLLYSSYHSKSMIEEIKELPSAQPEPIRINLNEPIKVKLTDWGKEIYYHQYDRTNQIVGRKVCKSSYPKVDEDGYTTFQLWGFMELYGVHMGITLPNVIEPLEIVCDAPTIEPECKNGEWIYGEHDVAMCDGYWCNKCGFFVPWDYKHKSIDYIKDYHFCPNCGKKMERRTDG